MKVVLTGKPFNPWSEIADYQARCISARDVGATSVFVGTMRENGALGKTHKMFLEHYPGMTEAELKRIVERALSQHSAPDALVIHRIGDVEPGDPIVLVAVWGQHRHPAYAANRQIMEELKSTAPFWKKEYLEGHAEWVPENTPV